MKRLSIISLSLSSILLAPVYADDHSTIDNFGPYIGAGYGLLSNDGEDGFDNETNAYNFYIGSQFHQSVAIEAGYIDFGEYGNNSYNAELDGYTLGVNLGLPITDYVTLFAKGGQLWWDAEVNSIIADGSTDGNELYYGAGVSFAMSEGWDLRVDYTRYDFDFEENEIGVFANIDDLDTKIDYASIAVQYTF